MTKGKSKDIMKTMRVKEKETTERRKKGFIKEKKMIYEEKNEES